jgi:hypothetical protein
MHDGVMPFYMEVLKVVLDWYLELTLPQGLTKPRTDLKICGWGAQWYENSIHCQLAEQERLQGKIAKTIESELLN